MVSISNHMDRISELPDALICHILSFLRTKEAVKTSVLSTKWKKQWTRVPSLDLDWTDYPIGIERVLLFRGSSNIQKVRLCLMDPLVEFGTELDLNLDYARIDGWIRTVMWRNVVELDLTVDPAQDQETMELPLSLFTCRTLKVLKLDSYYNLNPPTTGCFPCLKVLVIMVMVCDYDTSGLERIFCNCPALEDLTVMFNFLEGGCDINISLPELKVLDILCLGWLDENEEKYSIFINAPKLVNFDLAMHHCQHLSALVFHVNANSLFKANIRLTRMGKQYDSRIAILDTIASVKHLDLFLSSSFCFEALPDFDNLTHLELDAPLHLNCWALLVEFLKRSPNLEDLAIEHKNIGGRICDMFDLPEVVPDCMLFHLKTIKFTNFKGRPDEMAVAKHLLKYSKVLKKMTVFTAYPKRAKKQAIDTEFLGFERGSETCQVEIL